MTTLYRPVPITSAEQAEALPVGTVAIRDGALPRLLVVDATGPHWLTGARAPGYVHPVDMVGWTALVRIEAEEEWTAMGSDDGEPWIAHVGRDGIDGSRKEAELYAARFGGFLARRNLTPWEEA